MPAGPDWAANIGCLCCRKVCASPAGASAGWAQPAPEGSGHSLGGLLLPYALARKGPNARWERAWPWVFPQQNRWRDRESGSQGRLFLLSLATQLLERDQDIRTIQELLGHQDVGTTMNYTPVLNCGPLGVRSPADILVPTEQVVPGAVGHGYIG